MTDVLEIFAPYGPGSLFGALLVLVVLYFGKQFLEEFKAQNERKANIDLKREERKQDEVNERAQRDRERSQGMAAKVDHIADRVDLLYKESAR